LRLLAATSLAASNGTPVAATDEIHQLIGTLVTADADALTLRLDGTGRVLRVPRLAIRTSEVGIGKRSAAKTGAIVGAAAGAVLLYATANPCAESEVDCPLDSHPGERLGAAALGALTYGLAGAAIGSCFKAERWIPVPLDGVRVSLRSTWRGVGLFVSVRF
jgi:hypothetical protein